MDNQLARRISEELRGKMVGTWQVGEFIGAGKSACVLRGVRGREEAAIKIFDPDLVQKYGEDTELARIDRERSLIGKHHPHLVRIFEGGKCPKTTYLYVAMELVPAKDLSQLIDEIPRESIWTLIQQLASAAEFLEQHELAHRDIKPSNIAVSDDFTHLTLLDLGVLKPFGNSTLTDHDGRPFVGTLQYSPPELLFRVEEDDKLAWRAVTFYQIGAVLHDLIKKQPIFQEYSDPYPRLVEAVKGVVPELDLPGADPELIRLARSCLSKHPKVRLKLLDWSSFNQPKPVAGLASLRERVRRQQEMVVGNIERRESASRPIHLSTLLSKLWTIIRTECLKNSHLFPPVEFEEKGQTEDATRLCVLFPPAPGRGIRWAFGIYLNIQMIDAVEDVIEITGGAAVADRVQELQDFVVRDFDKVYSAVFQEEICAEKVLEFLYGAMAIVLELSSKAGNGPQRLIIT